MGFILMWGGVAQVLVPFGVVTLVQDALMCWCECRWLDWVEGVLG